ncbi:MAG: 4Fe-4S dicluster domain-containing protein [Chloroflexi bacterium]|nr:4Fe-4S dicluster domain-containing protein [Chloroflexota bacterium]
MSSPGHDGDSQQDENRRKWLLSRRRLLKLMGMAGASAVAMQLGGGLIKMASGAGEDASSPKRLRRWGMIIDLRRCDGCQSQETPPKCTEACIDGHFAPEPMEWIEVYEHKLPGSGTRFLPTPCMQCQNPPCVNVCPVGATWSTPEGHVLIDQNRCIGCRMCMAACPYERRFFTWGQPSIPPEALFLDYSPEHQVPAKKGVVYKCDFCPEMARSGRLPFCAQACPQHAIYYGDLEEDLATNGEEVVQFTTFLSRNNAYRYKEDLGTNPRVYYIPGHGEVVGRTPDQAGKLPTRWKWQQTVQGATTWKRSGH